MIGLGGLGFFLALLCLLLLATQMRRQKRLKARFAAARAMAQGGALEQAKPRARSLAATVAGFGSAIARSGLLSKRTLDELEKTLQAGGFRGGNGLGLFVGSKILLVMSLPLLALLLLHGMHSRPMLHYGAVAAAAVVGLLAPDMAIRRLRQSYLKAVERGLADGLDMMVICAEAGLALEPAIRRVSLEIVHAHPKLAEELTITSRELNLITDSRVALTNMGLRTGISSLKRLGTTLVQTIQYGTPLSVALRTLAVELRQETLTRYEERAARLPVLLTVPMILFILPCVFLVVAGPVAVQVLKSMKH
jgi:tight adherence protein C